jgi:hypothetical protein
VVGIGGEDREREKGMGRRGRGRGRGKGSGPVRKASACAVSEFDLKAEVAKFSENSEFWDLFPRSRFHLVSPRLFLFGHRNYFSGTLLNFFRNFSLVCYHVLRIFVGDFLVLVPL